MTKPSLQRIDEFRNVLKDYHVSDSGRDKLKDIELVLLRAPSAGGRNTIIRELTKTGKYIEFVTDTTRPPRKNDGVMERDGVEYWFRSEEQMLQDLRAGNYIEAEIIHNQQVSGMSIRELQTAAQHDKIAISDIHIEGVANVIDAKPDTHVIFITPPSFDEWVKRLKGRGEMSDEEYRNRFSSAEYDYAHALQHDYYSFVVNDSYLHSAEHVRHIVETKDYPLGVNREGREVAELVFADIQKHL